MKKTFFTLIALCAMGNAFAQSASTFGAKDVLLTDFETVTLPIKDSLWVDTLKTTPVTTLSPFITIVDNPLPLENESNKAAKYARPAGAWRGVYMLFNKNINFSETPYLQVQVYPIKDKAPAKTTLTMNLYNDKGEVIVVSGSKGNIPQDEWTTFSVFLGKQKSSVKYNAIEIFINPEDSLSKAGGTEYLIDQIGFKAMTDGSKLPATVFYETFGGYHQGWQDGKVAGMQKGERGKSNIYASIKGFTSGIPWKFMDSDTMAVMEARTWGMGSKYEGASGNGRLGLSNGLKGSLFSGPIDVRGFSDLKLSFGIGTQTWWPYDGAIANARPRIEVSINGGAFYELFSTSTFLKATGEKKDLGWGMMDVYEDQIFTMVEYPLTTEDGSPIASANTVELKIGYKAGSAHWIDDMWFAGAYSPNSVGMKATTESSYVVSPNPASDFILTSGCQNVSVSDLNGRVLVNANKVEKVDISNLTKGLYIVKVQKDGVVSTGKLIKK